MGSKSQVKLRRARELGRTSSQAKKRVGYFTSTLSVCGSLLSAPSLTTKSTL